MPESPSQSPTTNQPVLSVAEIAGAVKRTLETAFARVRVRGEISRPNYHASGHLYFTLKDEQAVIDAVCWRGRVGHLKLRAEQGLEVIVTGRVSSYPGSSKYQIVVEEMELAGEGAILKLLEERRKQLLAEGLFDPARKKPIPYLPAVIGVITSPTGAVIRDILHRLADRFPRHVLLWPVRVQGEGAAAEVAAAIEGFNRLAPGGAVPRPELIIVARGGGSLEDLWAFNDERLARAIAASPVPVVSAIGHETDFTLADFAADLRAPTPSVAAELLVPDRRDLLARVQALQRRLATTQAHRLRNAMQRADRAALRLHALRPQARLEMLRRRQEDAARRLHALWRDQQARRQAALRHADAVLRAHAPRRRLEQLRARLLALAPRPQAAVARTLQRDALRLRALARSLEAVSPLATVARGYALITKEDGTLVRSVAQVQPGERVDAQVGDGRLTLSVES